MDNEADIIGRLSEALGLHQCIKWYATMDIAFYRTTPDGEIQNTTGRFRTQTAVTSDSMELSVDRMINDFLHAIETFNRLGSQWKVDYIIDFSTTLAKFEHLNEDIAVNVMTFDEGQPIPLYVTPHRQRKHLINLLLLTDDERDVHHYVLIRDPFAFGLRQN